MSHPLSCSPKPHLLSPHHLAEGFMDDSGVWASDLLRDALPQGAEHSHSHLVPLPGHAAMVSLSLWHDLRPVLHGRCLHRRGNQPWVMSWWLVACEYVLISCGLPSYLAAEKFRYAWWHHYWAELTVQRRTFSWCVICSICWTIFSVSLEFERYGNKVLVSIFTEVSMLTS